MNKTYKVRATRTGALQVVSELTSSVAAIGTKTVVTVATTMVAGAAIAAIPAVPSGEDTQTVKTPITDWSAVANEKYQNFVFEGAKGPGNSALLSASESGIFAKTMFVIGDADDEYEYEYGTGIWISGAEATATNTGTIYVQGKVADSAAAKSWQLHGMGAANGATAVNQGTIEADNAYGMYVGKGSGSSTIINDTTGEIRVTTQGAGMELGGASGSKAFNHGTITVEAPAAGEINKLKFTHGVLIQESSNNEFTNYGTIDATNGTSAIEVKKAGTDGNVINLEAGSRVLGLVHVDAAATNTTLNLNGMQGNLLLQVDKATKDTGKHFTLNVNDGADVTLQTTTAEKDDVVSVIDVANIQNGRLTASIFQSDKTLNNAFRKVTIGENGIFNIEALNSRTTGTAATDPANRLLLAYDADYKLEGGRLQVAGQDYTGALKIGTASEKKGSGELTVVSGNYAFSDVEVAPKGKLTLEGGRLSVTNTLKATGGTKDPTRGAIQFEGGTLNIQGSQIFVNNGKDTVADWGVTDVVALMSGIGVVELTDSFEYSLADLRKAQETLNKGAKNTLQVAFVNGTLVLGQDEALTGGQIAGLNLADQTATADNNGSFSVSSNTDTTVAAVDFGGKEASTGTVSITTNGGSATGALVLSGNNENVFAGLADTTKTVDVTGSLVLGNDAEATGTVNVETLQVDDLTVVGTFTANNVTVDTTATVDAGAAFTVNSLSGGTTTVSGTLDVTEVKKDAKVQAENGGTVVLRNCAKFNLTF